MFHSKFIRSLQPKYFFLGIALGFISCCVAGFFISKTARLHHFIRMFDPISATMHYYPTAHEMLATARRHVSRDKILVLIGGSSIFRGTGQNPNDVWSLALQKSLGDKFKVLNYGIDGGSLPTFGGVVFRMLREEYSKIIFVSTCTYSNPGPMTGSPAYSYFFWDAYYKKLFHPDENEQRTIEKLRREQLQTASGIEQHLLSFLDSIFYFKNLWNWVGYRYLFSVWMRSDENTPFQARRRYVEKITPDLDDIRVKVANDHERFKSEADGFNRMIFRFTDFSKHPLQMNQKKGAEVRKQYEQAFSPRYRPNILCVVVNENPRHIASLSKKAHTGHKFLINKTCTMLKNFGYNTIYIGHDFSPEDYFDGGHLAASGGHKIAAQVATKVKEIAVLNGYY